MEAIKLTLLGVCFFFLNVSAHGAIEIAHEAKGIHRFQFSLSTRNGLLSPKDCTYCEFKTYRFDQTLLVKKRGESVSIDQLLSDYYRANSVTIKVEKGTDVVKGVKYK